MYVRTYTCALFSVGIATYGRVQKKLTLLQRNYDFRIRNYGLAVITPYA